MGDLAVVEHRLAVRRTARYYTLGSPHAELREIWVACHGYGQLARYFARRFEALADGTRLIVLPEALSRFYLEAPGGSHATARVGASWMTREDRSSEIEDYLAYLEAVYRRVQAELESTGPRLVVLGFSQGAATACRWAALGQAPVEALIVWGERLPADLDWTRAAARLRSAQVFLVTGQADPGISPAQHVEDQARLAEHGVAAERLVFGGGHELDAGTLRQIAERIRSGPRTSLGGVPR